MGTPQLQQRILAKMLEASHCLGDCVETHVAPVSAVPGTIWAMAMGASRSMVPGLDVC